MKMKETSVQPTVSIICTSYNHSKFINQAIDSFLAQKTSFAIEILINDDASSDDTTQIIKDYQKKYPDIVKPIFQKENQYSLGKRNMMMRFLLPKAQGKYLALCEGDDYWIDNLKIQKQVDFMEKNKDYAVCFHPVKVTYDNNTFPDKIFPKDKGIFTIRRLLKKNFIQTNSVLYRRQNYEKLNLELMPGDYYLHIYHAQFGKIGFIDEVMSVYRKHSGGIWWDKDQVWKSQSIGHLKFYRELIKLFGDNKNDLQSIHENMLGAIKSMCKLDDRDSVITEEVFKEYFSLFRASLFNLYDDARSKLADDSITSQLNSKQKSIELRDSRIRNLEYELNTIKNSLTYRVGESTVAGPRVVNQLFKLVYKGYVPDTSKKILDQRSDELHDILIKHYNYKNKISGIRVAIVAININNKLPTSSLFIRLISPLTSSPNHKKINLSFYDGNLNPRLPSNIDVCIIQRTAFGSQKDAHEFVEDARKKGIKLILDIDDAFESIDTSHSDYRLYDEKLGALETIRSAVDETWVSTEKLSNVYENSAVLRNTLDQRLWVDRDIAGRFKNKTINILYMGTATHGNDLNLILRDMERINTENPDAIHLTIIGVTRVALDRDWITVASPPLGQTVYPKFITWLLKEGIRYDVGIAPLVKNNFNESKSDIKVLDYLGLGLLPVVSDIKPYANSELHDFVVRVGYDKDDWYDALFDIVNHRKKYQVRNNMMNEKIGLYLKERSAVNIAKVIFKRIRYLDRM